MRIIALTGNATCGKTTTLTLVHELLLHSGGLSTALQTLPPVDFSDIVLYQQQKIAFFTLGDYSGRLITAISDYKKAGIDLLICACNNKLTTARSLIEKFQHDLWEKTVTANPLEEEPVNTRDAVIIFQLM